MVGGRTRGFSRDKHDQGAGKADKGAVKWQGDEVYVPATPAGEAVAIEETENGEWVMRFYTHRLGFIDGKRARLVRKTALQPNPAGAFADQQRENCNPSIRSNLLPIH